MGTRRHTTETIREHRVTIRFTADQHALIRQRAAESGLTASGWIAELAAAPKVRRIHRRTDLPAAGQAKTDLSVIRRLLAGACNNLNQLARHANTTGDIDVEEFHELRDRLRRLEREALAKFDQL